MHHKTHEPSPFRLVEILGRKSTCLLGPCKSGTIQLIAYVIGMHL